MTNTDFSPKAFDLDVARKLWHPIASSTDLVPRHVFHAQVLGRELALWRADDGNVNAWENRCLHRGVRLSIGINDGRELVCQYHGWRYANRTAGCTYIPAHPADAPARTICNNTYPVIEKFGLVWSGEAPEGEPLLPEELGDDSLVLRPLPINAALESVASALTSYQQECPGEQQSTFTVVCKSKDAGQSSVVFFLQPRNTNRTVIRGVLLHAPKPENRLATLREHNLALTLLRDKLEANNGNATERELMPVIIKPVTDTLSRMPGLASTGRTAALHVTIDAIDQVATDIKSLVLKPLDQPLPTFHPGAHIDVHLPNGLIRQYSLTNAPGQTDRYIIGVKREAESAGGSACIHDVLKAGDILAVSEPRNNFPLRRDAVNTLLIAGGIGITPLLSMAQALHHSALPFSLHYFVQDKRHAAFPEILNSLQHQKKMHEGLTAGETQDKLRQLLADTQPAHHVYLCGPAPMLEAARNIAAESGWPDENIHFEYFKNSQALESTGEFAVSLARSGLTLTVPAGKTLLSVLRENQVPLPSSCEQGACGTCKVKVLSGDPWHQDVYLTPSEKARGDCMMTCVSRSRSATLTLDL